jgi:hypothetical protein
MDSAFRIARRNLLQAGVTYLLAHLCNTDSIAQVKNESMTLPPAIEIAPMLLSAPIELAGNWGHMVPHDADVVIERMRHACLDGVRLLSDRQPTRYRVGWRTHRVNGLPRTAHASPDRGISCELGDKLH